MGFLFKSFIFFAFIAVIGYFAIQQLPELKQTVVESIDPTAKEARLIDEVDKTLLAMKSSLDDDSLTQEQISDILEENKILLEESREKLRIIAEINDSKSSLTGAGIGKVEGLVSNFTDPTKVLTRHASSSDDDLLYQDAEEQLYTCNEQ